MDSLQRLFREVADLDPDRRSRYFDAHEVDEEMRRNVESLLRFDGGSADLLTGVVGGTVEQFLNAGPEPFAGPYELVRLLGEGGMGSVHLAQRRALEPRRALLRCPSTRDQPGPLEHLQVLGDGLHAERERLRQLVHGDLAVVRQPREDRAPGRIGEGRKCEAELVGCHRYLSI